MPQTATQTFSLTAEGALTITTTSPLPDAIAGKPYSVQLAASGGVSPYTWGATGGSLPAGISLSSSGMLSGTPTSTGSFSFTVQATDSGA
jgi:hypothetical protein